MALTDSPSHPPTISAVDEQERRPQAEPLPSKRGEIGYVEGVHPLALDRRNDSNPELNALPARHPADRDQAPPSTDDPTTPDLEVENAPTPSVTQTDSSSNSMKKSSRLLGFLKPKKIPSFGGLQLTTILIFLALLLLLGGTVTAWVFATNLLKKASSNGGRLPTGQSTSVFVHVVFVIITIGQLIFLERRLFRLRGERYSYLHPGEVLPRHRNMNSSIPHTAIAFAPWNRPPLPTYAATLAQSGVGTGDVEDHLIAAPPPPAYGNTRGSTLLLTGYLRDSLRAQRPLSAHSQPAPRTTDRPLSYVSRDDQWEEIQDAERSRRLEETLNRLEYPPPTAVRS